MYNAHENIDYDILLKNTKNVEILSDEKFKEINFKNIFDGGVFEKCDIPYYEDNLYLKGD